MKGVRQKLEEEGKYIGGWYRILFNLQGTDEFKAYGDLFPSKDFDPKAHYEILNDRRNRELMVVLYQGDNPSIELLAQRTGLSTDDISTRIEFFRANGMRQIRIRNAA